MAPSSSSQASTVPGEPTRSGSARQEESAETLSAYLDDPAVAEVMTQVRDNDTAADVREEADKRLSRWASSRQRNR